MDNLQLYAPGGATSVGLGSYLRADPGPNFDQGRLFQTALTDQPYGDGALLSEVSAPRKFSLPLILASAPAGLREMETVLRDFARPGAFIDLQPQGVASSESVRFDVLAGRWQPEYSVRLNEISRRIGALELDVRPFGYWPTWILLASAASVGLPGSLTVPGASVLGDAPFSPIRLAIQPSVPTQYSVGATWLPDMLGWSLSARASAVALWPAASLGSAGVASLTGDQFAVGSQSWTILPNATLAASFWQQVAVATISQALIGAYSGRFRLFAHMKLGPSTSAWKVSADVTAMPNAAMGSAAPMATLIQSAGLATWGPNPSPAYTILDLGELLLPAMPSGMVHDSLMRVWAAPAVPSSMAAVPTPILSLAALTLLDSSNAGILARGMMQPTWGMPTGMPTVGRAFLDGRDGVAVFGRPIDDLASQVPFGQALQHYRGVMPRVFPSANRIDLLGGSRRVGAAANVPSYPQQIASTLPKAYYRFEGDAGPTMIDTIGSWHGSYSVVPNMTFDGAVGKAARWSQASELGVVPSMLGKDVATSWSIEMWLARYFGSIGQDILMQGDTGGANNMLRVQALGTTNSAMRFGIGDDFLDVADAFPEDSAFHHYVLTWDYATRTQKLWRDAAMLGSRVSVTTYKASGPIWVGGNPDDAVRNFRGFVDELAFYQGTALGSGIIASHFGYQASPDTGAGLPDVLARTAPMHAAVSVHYQPRFQFLKGL